MPDFTNVTTMFINLQKSLGILNLLRDIYSTCERVEDILTAYQNDPVFKLEVDHLYSPEQIAELAAMIADVQVLRSGWSTNHSQLLLLT